MLAGRRPFGTGGWRVDYFLSPDPSTLATIKVLAVLTGHVIGVSLQFGPQLTSSCRRTGTAQGPLDAGPLDSGVGSFSPADGRLGMELSE